MAKKKATRKKVVSEVRVFMPEVIAEADRNGWLWFHDYDSRRSRMSGFPDLVMVRGDRLLIAELKVGYRKPSPEQRVWLDALGATAAEVFTWWPKDWPEIRRVLA